MSQPVAIDAKPFVPARTFDASLQFYAALGWTINWQTDGLADLERAGSRRLLQGYYTKEWVENWMYYIDVADAQAWHDHAQGVIKDGAFAQARVQEPTKEDHGALVTYVWDPSGVLLHFAQVLSEDDG